MLDHTERMTARIGVGEEWWSVIEGFPLHRAFEDAVIAPDTARWLPQGSDAGGLGFFVATPVRSCNGLPLGLLILADHVPRPGFSDADRQALRTLVNAFTANSESLSPGIGGASSLDLNQSETGNWQCFGLSPITAA